MTTKTYTYNGITDTLPGWANRVGMSYQTLRARVLHGWTIEKALTKPLQEQHAEEKGYKRCSKCKTVKSTSEFYKLKRRSGKEYSPMCKECSNAYCKKRDAKVRFEVMSAYSNGKPHCAICGESRLVVLDVDHINGGGGQDRKKGLIGPVLYRRLKRLGYPPGYRILCRNCNWTEHLRLHFGYTDEELI